MTKPIVDVGTCVRWCLTALFVFFAWHWHEFARWCLLISSIFCEIYWYLWQQHKRDHTIKRWDK